MHFYNKSDYGKSAIFRFLKDCHHDFNIRLPTLRAHMPLQSPCKEPEVLFQKRMPTGSQEGMGEKELPHK
jgi:hypothetical protein